MLEREGVVKKDVVGDEYTRSGKSAAERRVQEIAMSDKEAYRIVRESYSYRSKSRREGASAVMTRTGARVPDDRTIRTNSRRPESKEALPDEVRRPS